MGSHYGMARRRTVCIRVRWPRTCREPSPALQPATFTWRWGSTSGRLLQWEPGAACVTSTANSGAVHASAVERRTRHTGSMSRRLMGAACGQPPAAAR